MEWLDTGSGYSGGTMNAKQVATTILYGIGKLLLYSVVGFLGLCAIALATVLLVGFIALVGGMIGGAITMVYNTFLGTQVDPALGAMVGSFLALFAGSTAGASSSA
jgi:hypothetical protein